MEIDRIQTKIYEVREQKVMLDFDLAELYEVETRVLNQAVNGILISFPKISCFSFPIPNGKVCHHKL